MQITRLPLGQLQANCYLVSCPKTKEGAIIDPVDSGDFIIQKIQDLGIQPQLIIATHGHFDHVLAALELKLALNLPFALHPADLPLLKKATRSADFWLKTQADPTPPVDRFLKDGDLISFGTQKLKVMETPGHTPGSICLYDQKQVLLSGDTVFKKAVGRTDYSYSNRKQMKGSLKKILKLPNTVRILPGHGEATTVGAERRNLDKWVKKL